MAGRKTKEVRCVVCNHVLKRRKYRKAGAGPSCMRKLQNGYAGVQIEAFKDFDFNKWKETMNPKEEL